jgi:hypothetical protein
MRLAARPGFYGVCKRGAAAKRAGAYGRLQRLINRIPLFRVWSEHRNTPWAELLGFWGLPNLQVINRDAHAAKCAAEARDRGAGRRDFARYLGAALE